MTIKILSVLGLVIGLCACVSTEQKQLVQDKHVAAGYNLQLGIEYFRQGNLPLAKEKLDRSLVQNPNNAQTYAAAGLLYEQLNEIDKADQYYGRAVELEPDNGDVINSYAVFLCRRGDRVKGEKLAVRAANNALYKSPEVAWLNAGFCAQNSANAAAAEQYFGKSLQVNPKFAPAVLALATLKLQANDALQARGLLERFHSGNRATAESLWLGVEIEKKIGNYPAVTEYARRLKSEFPSATQTNELLKLENKK